MFTSALAIKESSPHCGSRALKTILRNRSIELNKKSGCQIYLNSQAISGRHAMETLLKQAAQILEYGHPWEENNWNKLTFEKVHLIRSTLIDVGYSVNTINLTLSALKGVTKAAFNLNQISADDMMRINSIKSLKGSAVRVGRRLTASEITKLLNENKGNGTAKGSRDKAILCIGVGAGLRCAEICALNISDVNFKEGLLTVRRGKGRKYRQIYLAQGVLQKIESWLKFRNKEDGALFTSIRKDGKVEMQRLSASGLAYALKSLQASCNVIPFSPHDMRRTFITQLLENNIDINTVRQLAGHSDVSTTVRYDKRDLEWQKRASTGFSLMS